MPFLIAAAAAGCGGASDSTGRPALTTTEPEAVVDERGQVETDVEYGVVAEHRLLLDVYHAGPDASVGTPGHRPALVFVHGGAWAWGNRGDFRGYATRLAEVGYVGFSVDYRLAPQAGGRYPAPLDDVQRAVRWVRAHAREYGADPDRVGAVGESAGAHLAALLGTCDTRDNSDPALAKYSSRVQCVMDLYGPADLTQPFPVTQGGLDMQAKVSALFGLPYSEAPEAYEDASPLCHVDGRAAPFLIAHGVNDDHVPLDQSVRLDEALRRAGVESTLLTFEGEGHVINAPEHLDQIWAAMLPFLERHLAP